MIDIIDNYMPDKEFWDLFNILKVHNFDWHMSNVVDYKMDSTEQFDVWNMQFCHTFYARHEMRPSYKIIMPFLMKLNPVAIIRIKANVSMATETIHQGGLHIDVEDDDAPDCCKTSILYMNTNDGYTVFEDGTKVESVMNRFVTFPHTLKHAGTTCTNAPFRMVINFNYVTGNIKE